MHTWARLPALMRVSTGNPSEQLHASCQCLLCACGLIVLACMNACGQVGKQLQFTQLLHILYKRISCLHFVHLSAQVESPCLHETLSVSLEPTWFFQ